MVTFIPSFLAVAEIDPWCRGYVAVAVSTAHGTYTREVDTGSADREKNMVAFAGEGLKLLRDVILGKAVL